MSEEEYLEISEEVREREAELPEEERFQAGMGGQTILEALKKINIDNLSVELRYQAKHETSIQRKTEALKRLKVVEAFRRSNKDRDNKPDWMVMTVIPVVPPELRTISTA